MPTQQKLRLTDVSKRYASGRAVLDKVSLEVDSDEIVAFIGPKGCGKSTLLRLIAGLTPLTSGKIEHAGKKSQSSRGRTAFFGSDGGLLPWRTVEANIQLPLELAGVPKADIQERTRATMKLLDIAHVAQRYPMQLTSGNRMRAAIARGLITHLSCLLMDEPFATLDAITRNKLCAELMKVRSKQHFTACFVTHSAAEAVFLSSRIVVLAAYPGRISEIVEIGQPYPRKLTWRETDSFQEAINRVRSALNNAQEGPS